MTDVDTPHDSTSVNTDANDSDTEQLKEQIEKLEQQNEKLSTKLANMRQEKETYERKAERLSRENKKMKQAPNFVATVQECFDDNEVLIKQHGNNQEVVTPVTDELYEQLEPGSRVGVDNSLNIVRTLEDETDMRAQVMQVTESPDVSYSDIGGLNDQLKELRESVELPLLNTNEFQEVGIDPPSGVLLHGPPGTGKTMMAKAVAAHTDATMIQLSGSDLARKFIGEGAQLVRELFEHARDEQPAVIFIDELDAIAGKRTDSKTSGDAEVQRTLMQLLNEMDGFENRGDISIIAATNRADMLDDAVLRPGRFDRVVEVPEPDADGREEIFRIHMRDMNTDDVSVDALVQDTEGLTGAELKSICTEAGMFAIRDNRTVVTHKDFVDAYEKVAEEEPDAPIGNSSPAFA